MSWTKLPPIDGFSNPCLCCPRIPGRACMTKIVAVGFGSAFVSKDGVQVLDGESPPTNEFVTFSDAEELAIVDPDHDWRVHLHGPMHGEVYQRHGFGEWILVEKDDGFA